MGRARKPRVVVAEDRPLTPEEAEAAAAAAAYAASDADYAYYAEEEEAGAAAPAPSVADAIAALEVCGDTARAEAAASYHKAPRRYLGVPVPLIEDMARLWREACSLDERIALARGLWASDIHEAKIAAAKLLTQARMRPDDAAWELICEWVEGFDAWSIADHAASAGARRLSADPARLDVVEGWLGAENMWTRRAALVMTLPFTKQNHPSPAEAAARARVLDWCVRLAPERDWFIQKAIGWWLRELSKHDPQTVADWLAAHGETLKAFARKEASKRLG